VGFGFPQSGRSATGPKDYLARSRYSNQESERERPRGREAKAAHRSQFTSQLRLNPPDEWDADPRSERHARPCQRQHHAHRLHSLHSENADGFFLEACRGDFRRGKTHETRCATGLTILCSVITSPVESGFSSWCPVGGQGKSQKSEPNVKALQELQKKTKTKPK
jgi:hypothetical protein